MSKIRIAIIKFGGLSVGGSERYLQVVAANLSRDLFDVDYYYCDAAPYLGSSGQHGDTNPDRLKFMHDHAVRLIKFHVAFRDLTKPTFDWIDTDFWNLFDENSYDLALTVKSGHPEYPYTLLKIPLIEIVGLPAGIDSRPNIHVHPSQYQRKIWLKMGGVLEKSCVIPPPPSPPCTNKNLRLELKIPDDAIVAGFHQRADDSIFSPTPLEAFSRCASPNRYFILLGGGQKYRDQAKQLHLNRVIFLPETGNPMQVSRFLNTLDIFAHGRGDGETYGAVFAEAMLHGKPCLSHAVTKGDNAQVETMGPSGWFAANREEYAEKLELLFNDAILRNSLAQKAESHAQEYFSLESCLENLTRLFQKICGRPEIPAAKKRIPYGLSPLGFLYAGELNCTNEISHHVLSGRIPEEFYLRLVQFFLPNIRTFIDIGANTGLYGFVAAKECPAETKVHCFEMRPEYTEIDSKIGIEQGSSLNVCQAQGATKHLNWENLAMQAGGKFSGWPTPPEPISESQPVYSQKLAKTIYLNNWEKKVFVHLLSPGNPLDHHLRDMENVDFIKIDANGFEQTLLEDAKETIHKHNPILLIKISENRKIKPAKTVLWLQSNGYTIYRYQETKGPCYHFGTMSKMSHRRSLKGTCMYLCIHGEHASTIFEQLAQHIKRVNKDLIKRQFRSAVQILTRVFKKQFKKTAFYPFFYLGRNIIARTLKNLTNLTWRSS